MIPGEVTQEDVGVDEDFVRCHRRVLRLGRAFCLDLLAYGVEVLGPVYPDVTLLGGRRLRKWQERAGVRPPGVPAGVPGLREAWGVAGHVRVYLE